MVNTDVVICRPGVNEEDGDEEKHQRLFTNSISVDMYNTFWTMDILTVATLLWTGALYHLHSFMLERRLCLLA